MPRQPEGPPGDVVGDWLAGILKDYVLPSVAPRCHVEEAPGRPCPHHGLILRCMRCGGSPCLRHGYWSPGPPVSVLCCPCIAELEHDDDRDWVNLPRFAPEDQTDDGWPWSTLGMEHVAESERTIAAVRAAFNAGARVLHPDHRPEEEQQQAAFEFGELVKARDVALQMILTRNQRG